MQLEAVGSTYYRRVSRPMNYAYLTYDMQGTPLTFCNMLQIQAWENKDKDLPVTCYAGTYSSAPGGVGGQRQVPAALTPGKRTGIHCTGSWVGPRAVLGAYSEQKVPCSQRSSNTELRISSVWRIAIPITLSRPPHRHGRLRYFVPTLNEALLSNIHLVRPRKTFDSTGGPRLEICQMRLLHCHKKTSGQDLPNLCLGFTVCVKWIHKA